MKSTLSLSIIIAICLALASCQKSCNKSSPQIDAKENQTEDDSVATVEGIDLSDLTKRQAGSFAKLLNEEICPCGCPKTFSQCLAMDGGCKPGELLAQWSIQQLKEGAPEYFLYKAISEEINTGYLAPQVTINTLGAHSKGAEDAKVTIVEFADFECPACRLAYAEMKSFIEDNKSQVKIYFMHFPISAHPNAERAAIAAEAAGRQGKFWQMHDLLFTHTGPLSDMAIKELASKIFNANQLKQFHKDLKDDSILQKIKSHKAYALEKLDLVGTPTFMFNGRPYNLSSAKDGYELRMQMEKLRSTIKCD